MVDEANDLCDKDETILREAVPFYRVMPGSLNFGEA